MRERLQAARVLIRRGVIDPRRPDHAVRAYAALRRYGAFGGLTGYAAARYGGAAAVTDERGTLSFAELDGAANALARGLQAHGVGTGWVIAVLYRNHRGILLALSAANRIGARVVLMNTGFAGPQLADVCAREHVGAVLADQEFDDLLGALPAVMQRLTLDELIGGRSMSPVPAPRRPGGIVLLTSGTTGTPKGAPRSHIDPLQRPVSIPLRVRRVA